MAAPRVIADTGPLVAFFNRSDQYHPWARAQFDALFGPLTTCESVISEAVFLLQSDGLSTDPIFEAIGRQHLLIEFSAHEHWPDLRQLMKKYADLPMSLADACLVRMTELTQNSQVLTTDRHFRLYRRYGRQLIPCLAPF